MSYLPSITFKLISLKNDRINKVILEVLTTILYVCLDIVIVAAFIHMLLRFYIILLQDILYSHMQLQIYNLCFTKTP